MAYQSWSVIAGETPTETKWNILGTDAADSDARLTKFENTIISPSYASTINIDLSLGMVHYLNLTGNPTLTISGSYVKAVVVLYHNGAIRNVNWFANIDWSFDVVPTPGTNGVGSTDTYGFLKKPDGRWIGIVVSEGN